MKFKVTAITQTGETYSDIVDGVDRFAVHHDIRERGDRVLELKEVRANNLFSLDAILEIFHTVSLDEKVILTRNLATMVEAGLTISRSLEVAKRQTRNTHLQEVLIEIITSVKKGESFSTALSAFPKMFTSLLVSMVRAGEESGKLTESLRVASIQMERASNLQKKIKSALIYPSIVLSAMVCIGILMLIYVVPTLSGTFRELHASLPPTTQFIISASDFLIHNTVIALVLLGIFIFVLLSVVRSAKGKIFLDWFLLKVPIIGGLIVEVNVARATRTLASLFSSGVDMVLSVKITHDVLENSQYKKVFVEAEKSLTEGSPLSLSLAKHPTLFPPLVAEIVAVGEETGRLSSLLKETAEFYEESVERKTKDLSTVIEPFLMVIIGAMVGFFAISMIAPIYSLSSHI
ncbi:MAG: type II secretion system F family protein [Candidatus Pacebacteria bacterium]|nr:type II secretion system F family protein [Candidatus Paceibacterota bacterium]MBP9832390.1 type II secretion system F family protein [Candidatus Paceibacterota bacterium]